MFHNDDHNGTDALFVISVILKSTAFVSLGLSHQAVTYAK
jgi:hypothetical protein